MKNLFTKLKNNQSGSILIQSALTLVTTIAILGMGVDMSMAYLYKSKLSSALDAAALAGAKSFHSTTRDAEITAFFNSNFDSSYLGGSLNSLVITEVDSVTKTLSVSTDGTIDTIFMKILGFDSLDVAASAETTSKTTGLELVMILDATGSMRNTDGTSTTRMDSTISASLSLVNSLFGSEATSPNLKISIVPYVTTVNIGALMFQQVRWNG
ncbi:MAG: pilus assembly protein TadG-related protein [Emcibacteraceae bacterium]|nr:pilus assembly protein TadG-related protein [Emcibacteraceae bacterium]